MAVSPCFCVQQFQDDLHAKQTKIEDQKKMLKEYRAKLAEQSQELNKLKQIAQKTRKEKEEWQSKTIAGITGMIVDRCSQTLELEQQQQHEDAPQSVDERVDGLSLQIKQKYASHPQSKHVMAMGIGMGIGIGIGGLIGFVLKEEIKRLLRQK